MKIYAVIDIKNGDEFEDFYNTNAEALKNAQYQWERFTAAERGGREMFAVMAGELDECGCFKFNTAETIKEYK